MASKLIRKTVRNPLRAALLAGAAALTLAAVSGTAMAGPTPSCLSTPTCSLDDQTFTTGSGPGVSSNGGLTFIAQFTTSGKGGQSNSNIEKLVQDYLALSNIKAIYLGRQDGTDLATGVDSITTTSSNSGLSGSWKLDAGSTVFVGSYVAIHAGDGQKDNLFSINTPGTSGTWDTNNGKALSNFDLFYAQTTPQNTPEPGSLALLGTGLIGLGFALRRRRRA